MLWLREDERGLTFKVLVQPRSAKNGIVGLHGDALKIKITAPPVEGAANSMCVELLAKRLKVPKSSIEIAGGLSSRAKVVRVGVSPAGAEAEKLKTAILSLAKS